MDLILSNQGQAYNKPKPSPEPSPEPTAYLSDSCGVPSARVPFMILNDFSTFFSPVVDNNVCSNRESSLNV